jgi:apolipoprotein N-acyltransferase
MSSWIWNVYPIDWLGLTLGWLELPMIGFYWTTVSAVLAVGGVGLFFLTKLFLQFVSLRFLYVGFPFLWMSAELIGSLVFSLFLYGPGGSIGTAFSMGYLGYVLGEHGLLIQLAGIYGVYSLTVLYIAMAVGGVYLWNMQHRKVLYVVVGCVIFSSTWGLSEVSVDNLQNKVAVIDTTLPIDIASTTQRALHTEALIAAKETNPKYILFPEDSRVFNQSLEINSLRALLTFTQADTEAVIIDSGRVATQEGAVLQTVIYAGETKQVYQSQKRYLVPQGEYMPYIYLWLLNLVGQAESSLALNERLTYRVGPDTSQEHFAADIPAVLFCFEVVDPRGVRKTLQEREETPPFVAHILSHAWIHDSVIFKKQLETMLRVQAIWNDVYIVSAANQTDGYTITPSGNILYPEVQAEGKYWSVGTILIP